MDLLGIDLEKKALGGVLEKEVFGGVLEKEVLDQHATDKHLLDQQVFWVVL